MGACNIGGTFSAYDWESGIESVQMEDEFEYGHRDGYSGASNSCCFRYIGDKSHLTKKELKKYVDERFKKLGTRDGEIIQIGILEYHLLKTKFEESFFNPEQFRYLFKGQKANALLLGMDMFHQPTYIIASGNLVDMKKMAHNKLRGCNYSKEFYILTKQKMYTCTYESKSVKRTTRKSDDKTLILPLYEYAYYGWAAC